MWFFHGGAHSYRTRIDFGIVLLGADVSWMDLAWVPFYLSGFIRFEAAGVVNMLLLLENLILRFCKYQTTKSIRVRMLIYNAGPGPVISPESLSTGDVAAPTCFQRNTDKSSFREFTNLCICGRIEAESFASWQCNRRFINRIDDRAT